MGHVGKPLIYGLDGRPLEFVARSARTGVRRGALAGVPGDLGYGGMLINPAEYQAALKNLTGRVTRYEQMLRRSGIVAGAVRLRTLPILAADWEWHPPQDDPTNEEIAASDRAQRRWITAPRTSWAKLLRWLTSGLWHGFAVAEGEFGTDADGYLIPRKWEFRSQHSIALASQPWEFDADGNLVGINQDASARLGDRSPATMQAQNCLVYTHAETANVEGEAELRAIERAEFMSHNALVTWGIKIQRWGSPSPSLQLAEGQGEKERAESLDAISRYQAGEDTALIYGNGQKLEAFGASDGESAVADGFVRALTEEIATALGVPYMVMGQAGAGGTQALGSGLIDMSALIINADADEIASCVSAFESRLCAQDNGPDVRPPVLRPTNIERRAGETILSALNTIKANGGHISEADFAMVRERFGLPPPEPVDITSDAVTSLNGAQVTAIVDVASRAKAGEITHAQAIAIIVSGFPIDRETAIQIAGGETENEPGSGPAAGGRSSSAASPAASSSDVPDSAIDDETDAVKPGDDAIDEGDGKAPKDGAIEQHAHHGCTHELSRADAATAAAGIRPPRRPARGVERFVDFARIEGQMDDAVTQLTRTTEDLRARAAEALVAQVRKVVEAGDVSAVRRITTPKNLRSAVERAALETLREVHAEGRVSVRRELNRQKVAKAHALPAEMSADVLRLTCDALITARVIELVAEDAPPSDKKNAAALMAEQARRMTDRVLGPLEQTAQDRAVRLLQSGDTLAGADERGYETLLGDLVDRSLKTVAQTAAYSVAAVFALGRDGSARDVQAANDEVGAAVDEHVIAHYSTLLDNVCDYCQKAEDLSVGNAGFLVGSKDYLALLPPLGPNPLTGEGCEGGDLCRCTYIYEVTTNRQALPRDLAPHREAA